MKIGIAIYNFNPKKGGAERYAYDIATILSRKGHEIFLFCSLGVEVPGITLVRFNTMPFPRWLRNFSFALNHRKYVKLFNLDIMLGFGNTFDLDVYQSHGGVQRIWMEREIASYDDQRERSVKAFLLRSSINQMMQRWIEEYPIRTGRYSRIVAISDMIKGHMTEHYNLTDDSIDVVYNGVDTERFRPAAMMPEGPPRILFSAGNFRLKGLSPLLFALGEVSKETKDFRLMVMGRGRKERYMEMVDALNIGNNVTFLGESSSPEDVYRDAHILVHPTFYDACSLTTMESMASGLPTITTKWNGAATLISEREGYVIDEPRNVASLASAIKALLDRDRMRSMGKAARAKLEDFTIEKNAAAMERICKEAADSKQGKGSR
ncbi:MAG: Lipopolysaccharide core biosynthesis protein RfaG [Syntrophorhabdus sp. PtaU1.Bin058]|nr:MAG: Lipopolysaccharide core biosynthesis protein RfaG [Syntrophorhabdus sp. PtaU1.Bin058]